MIVIFGFIVGAMIVLYLILEHMRAREIQHWWEDVTKTLNALKKGKTQQQIEDDELAEAHRKGKI